MKIVLYVSGNTALWVCFKRRVVVDCLYESVSLNSQSMHTSCDWLTAKHTDVHLLVDSEQTEIDAHPLQQVGSGWSYRSSKKALQQRLEERFPDAIVRTAKKTSKLGAALVQHINLPDATRRWLSGVEIGGITFCSITTVAELLADRLSAKAYATVVVSVAPDFIRHTYCSSGYALFTRAVIKSNTTEHIDQFKQTLDYLSASSLIENPVPVHAVGLSVNDASVITEHALVSELINGDTQATPIKPGDTLRQEYANELSIAGLLLDSAVTRINGPDRQVSCAIQKHIAYGVRQTKIRVFAMLALMVAVSLGYTASTEWQRSGQTIQLLARKAELSVAIKQYQHQASKLSPNSALLSTALLDRVAIESGAGINPAILLTVLAEAFTQYRELELQELNWVVVDATDQAHEADYAANSGMAVSGRTALPLVGALPSITRATLIGKIVVGESLREQHEAFIALTDYLEQQSMLSNLTVLQAPLMTIDSASHLGNGESIRQPMFQLQFELSRSVNNEA